MVFNPSSSIRMPSLSPFFFFCFLKVGSGSVARRMLEKAVFCPCPCGFEHPDSFRFAEALEAGCLPVVGSNCGAKPPPLQPLQELSPGEKEEDHGDSSSSSSGYQHRQHHNYFLDYAEYASRALGAPPLGSAAAAATVGLALKKDMESSHQMRLSPEQLLPVAGSGADWAQRASECAAAYQALRLEEKGNGAGKAAAAAVNGDAATLLEHRQVELRAWWVGVKSAVAKATAERLRKCCM